MAREKTHRSRRGHEPCGSSARRRRRQSQGQSSADALGFPDIGEEDEAQQAHRQAHCRAQEVRTRSLLRRETRRRTESGLVRVKTMRATRTTRTAARRSRLVKRTAKRAAKRVTAKNAKPVRPLVKAAVVPPEPVLYKLCKPGWAVIVERIANAQGTRFVCPFCPRSHRVPGPVRGFKKIRRAQWSRLRRVEE